jgi:colanic acid/amylovoran biosynthesis protein
MSPASEAPVRRDRTCHSSDFVAASNARICLLGASLASDNLGVAALAMGAITAARHIYPRGQVFLLDYSRKPARYRIDLPGKVTEVELVNIRFSRKLLLKNNIARLIVAASLYRLLPSSGLKQRFIDRNPVLRRIIDADVIGSIAGGDSFSDLYGWIRLLYVSLPQILVLLLKKPLVLLPQTIGPFKGVVAKNVGRYILRRAAVVYSRDEESLDEVRSLVAAPGGRLRKSYDVAFGLEPLRPEPARFQPPHALGSYRPLVGLNVSGLLNIGGYKRNNMFNLKADYRQVIRAIVPFFADQGIHVLLVPHVFGSDSESDTIASREVYRELADKCKGRLHVLEAALNAREIKWIIGQCDIFVGARMHACIAALSQCIPAVGLAYSRKFRGVFGSIRMEKLVIDLRDHDTQSVVNEITKIYQSRDEIRQQLEKIIPEARRDVLNLFDTSRI